MAVAGQREGNGQSRGGGAPPFQFAGERPLLGGRLAERMPSIENMQRPLAFQLIQILVDQMWMERHARAVGRPFERMPMYSVELLLDEQLRVLLNDEKGLKLLREAVAEVDFNALGKLVTRYRTLLKEERELVDEWRLSLIAFWLARHNEAVATVRLGSFETSYVFNPPIAPKGEKGGRKAYTEMPEEFDYVVKIPFDARERNGELEVRSREPLEPATLVMLGNLFAEAAIRASTAEAFTQIMRDPRIKEVRKIELICKWFERTRGVRMDFSLDAGGKKETEKTEGETVIPVVLPSKVRGRLTIYNAQTINEATLFEIGNRLNEAGITADLDVAARTYEEKNPLVQTGELLDIKRFGETYAEAHAGSVERGEELCGIRIRFETGKAEEGFHDEVVKRISGMRKIQKPAAAQAQKTSANAASEDIWADLFETAGEPEPLISKVEPIGVIEAGERGIVIGVLLFNTSLEQANEAARMIRDFIVEHARDLLHQASVYIQPHRIHPPKTVEGRQESVEGKPIYIPKIA